MLVVLLRDGMEAVLSRWPGLVGGWLVGTGLRGLGCEGGGTDGMINLRQADMEADGRMGWCVGSRCGLAICPDHLSWLSGRAVGNHRLGGRQVPLLAPSRFVATLNLPLRGLVGRSIFVYKNRVAVTDGTSVHGWGSLAPSHARPRTCLPCVAVVSAFQFHHAHGASFRPVAGRHRPNLPCSCPPSSGL